MTKRLLSLSMVLNILALLFGVYYVQRLHVAHIPKKPVRVYVDMTSDVFHYGHSEFFKKAHHLGDYLIVGICTERDGKRRKHRSLMSVEERTKALEACRYVDEVIPDAPLVLTHEWLEKHGIDIVAHGDTLRESDIIKLYTIPHKLGLLKIVPRTQTITTKDYLRRLQLAQKSKQQ